MTAFILFPYLRTTAIACVYAFVIFFVFVSFYFTHSHSPTADRELVYSPDTISHHINLLDRLTKMNRLEEAKKELAYINLYTTEFPIKKTEEIMITSLQNEIASRENIYTDILSDFSYWDRVVKENPHYRDAYYMQSRSMFELFNVKQASLNIREVLFLDPLFEKGNFVLHELENRQ